MMKNKTSLDGCSTLVLKVEWGGSLRGQFYKLKVFPFVCNRFLISNLGLLNNPRIMSDVKQVNHVNQVNKYPHSLESH